MPENAMSNKMGTLESVHPSTPSFLCLCHLHADFNNYLFFFFFYNGRVWSKGIGELCDVDFLSLDLFQRLQSQCLRVGGPRS